MTENGQLLGSFIEDHSEAAFETLVERHINLVYSVAYRIVGGNGPIAEDVTQQVFIHLGQKAGTLGPNIRLAPWLYRHTSYMAVKVVRGERRRRKREAIAMEIQETNHTADTRWDLVAPHLDQSLNQLRAKDRESIILRFFMGKDLKGVGAALGISEDAAQKRVSRALERLRTVLGRAGVACPGIAAILSSKALIAAPPSLSASVAAQAIAASTTGSGVSLTLFKIITAIKLKGPLVSSLLVGTLMPLFVFHQGLSSLEGQEERLVEQRQILTDLQNVSVSGKGQARSATSLTVPSKEFRELMLLRGEVGRLRGQLKDLVPVDLRPTRTRREALAVMEHRYSVRVDQLKGLFDANPDHQIPELQYLTDDDWLFLVSDRIPDDPLGDRRILSRARTVAESEFGNRYLKPALEDFGKAHAGQFPNRVMDLVLYLREPIDPSILRRWGVIARDQLVPSLRRQVDSDERYLTVRQAIDPHLDQKYLLGRNEGHLFSGGPADFWDVPESAFALE